MGCFEQVYIFSPSTNFGNTWVLVKKYIEKDLQPIDGDPPMYYDTYRAGYLSVLISRQRQVVDFMKKNDYNSIFQIPIVIGDFADNPSFTRNRELLHSLYVSGRHSFISIITATQVYQAINPVIRKNSTHLFVFRLRNQTELNALFGDSLVRYTIKTRF